MNRFSNRFKMDWNKEHVGLYAQARARLRIDYPLISTNTPHLLLHLSIFSPPTCVNERVFLHVWLLVEPLAAVLTRVGPGVRVDEEVRRQGWRPLKTFTTYFAVETSFLKTWAEARLRGLEVKIQSGAALTGKQNDNKRKKTGQRCEVGGFISCERSHLRVHGFVLLQAHCVSKRFAADFTRERPSATVRPADVHFQTVRSGEHLVDRQRSSC